MSEDTTMTLKHGEHFSIDQSSKDSKLEGLCLFVRNNGYNIMKVSTDGESVMITIEKESK